MEMARVFKHWVSPHKMTLFVAEELALLGAATAGGLALAGRGALHSVPALGVAAMFTALVQACFYAANLYDLRVAQRDRRSGARFLRAGGLALLLAAVGLGRFLPALPHGATLGAALGALGAAVLLRLGLNWVLARPMRVLILGAGARARELAHTLEREGELLCEFLGFVDDGSPGPVRVLDEPAPTRNLPAPGGHGPQPPDVLAASARKIERAPGPRVFAGDVAEVAQRLRADAVVVACDDRRQRLPAASLLRCRLQGQNVLEDERFAERVLRRLPVNHLRESDLIFAEELRISWGRALLKRGLDLCAALALAILAAPVMALVALAVRLDSRGPIFYRQERVGLRGRVFTITKFRTMRVDAEKAGAQWAQANDPRVTRVGRFLRLCRLDELPQLFAVLRGDMTLVGPRPERPVFVKELKQVIPFYGLREAVKPGVTGWAQIRYPYGASVEDAKNKLEYDLYYVKNGSLFLDLSILFHTVRHVLLGRGAR